MALACAAALVLVAGSAASGSAEAFHPLSVTFVAPAYGWALGTGPCGKHVCLKLFETTDGGSSWSAQRLPAALVAQGPVVAKLGSTDPEEDDFLATRFADPSDGWIYGELNAGTPFVWSTHDGGKIWRQAPPHWLGRRSSIFDVEAAAGKVYLLGSDAGKVLLDGAAVTGGGWRILKTPPLGNPAGGGTQLGSVVLQGDTGWLVEGNDRGVTGSARLDTSGRWVAWPAPCAAVGDTFAVPAANPSSLAAVCIMGGFAFPLPKTAPHGATIGSSWLYVSRDGGKSFHAGPELSRSPEVYAGMLATPAPGVFLVGETHGSKQQLMESFDGGAHWTVVYRGNLVYLGFTTPTQGVAITGSQNGSTRTTRLIMSYDGGRHWKQVGP
jgi:hypothetical protein